jgi:hypothetical protein
MKMVVESQFFVRSYLPATEKQHTASRPAIRKIRLAAVIYQFCSIATHGPVDDPALVEAQQIHRRVQRGFPLSLMGLQHLAVRHKFASVLGSPCAAVESLPRRTQPRDEWATAGPSAGSGTLPE